MPALFAPAAPPERILAAVDFSEASRRAVEHAARIAREGDGEVTLLHVVTGIEIAALGRTSVTAMREAEHELLLEARTELAALAEEVESAGVAVHTRIEEGAAAERILHAAEAERSDLIIVATHGMGGFKRLVLGSVADAVARKSHVSVLLVR